MRAMWTGSVAFGLVNVPIKLYSATEDHDVRFHQVHAVDGGRVKMVRTCSVDGERLETKDLSKAYETETGRVVIMEDADFEGLPVPGVKEISVLEFVPSEQVDPILFDRSYYLEPEARALKPYVLLREALAQTERTAIVRVVLRTKTQLAALRVRDEVLVLQTMLWPDEVRAADFAVLNGDADVRPQELDMAASFIESLSSDFEPTEYRDDYREALLAVIDRKLSGGAGFEPRRGGRRGRGGRHRARPDDGPARVGTPHAGGARRRVHRRDHGGHRRQAGTQASCRGLRQAGCCQARSQCPRCRHGEARRCTSAQGAGEGGHEDGRQAHDDDQDGGGDRQEEHATLGLGLHVLSPLPAIGAPATRALENAGVHHVEELAGWSESEVLALHGMGPKAVGILRERLAQMGLAFRA